MRRRIVAGLVGGGVAAVLVVALGIVWPGLDAQETPPVDTAVWALRTGESRQFARVNTAIGELDTVRSVSSPSQIAQTGSGAYLFSESDSRVTRIDAAAPVDLDDEAVRASPSTPPGTVAVQTSGEWVAYLTDAGEVWAGTLGDAAVQIDPFREAADDEAPQYTAASIAVDERGGLVAYSPERAAVLRYDLAAGEVRGEDDVEPDEIVSPALTAAGETWVLVDLDDGEVRRRGTDAVLDAPVTSAALLSEPDPDGRAVYLADAGGLVEVSVVDGSLTTPVGGDDAVLGTPARPVAHDGEVYAAWLEEGTGGGTLWRSGDGAPTPLDYGGLPLAADPRPVLVESPDAVILNDTRSGWVWTVPDGALVPSSQDWTLDDRTNPATVESEEQLTVVIDPKPPVAEADAFGVRAGSLAALPVLLNDHDPNEDVLSIDPESVTGLDPGFGTVALTDDDQRLTVRVAADATGSATFTYRVTDGTSPDGLRSDPATVTLSVAPPESRGAPVWCGVDRCLAEWPTPEVGLGGTITVPVLTGWVDPEGDPLLLVSVTNPSGVGSVAATPAGDVVYQHSDSGSGGGQVELDVTVSDTDGESTTKPLVVTVAPQPGLTAESFAVVDAFDGGVTIDVAEHVTGTAGTLSLSSVRVLDEAAATATVVGGTTSFDLAASAPGTYLVGFTVGDGSSDATGTARVTLVPPDGPAELATAPVVAFVHPQEDTTLDVLAAVSNPTRRVLLLSDIHGSADAGASLSVDAVGQDRLRVAGTTADGAPGRIGTVSYTVSDGTDDAGSSVQGEAVVYLLAPAPELAPIAVDDAVVVRAGAQVDIPVVDNDVSPAGGRPILNPASVTSSTPDALAFASGDVLRYLAPAAPGEYGVEYAVSRPGSPSLADTATVRITVLDDEENRAPVPATLEGRVLSGATTTIPFDGFGVDPDGDAVRLDRVVTQPTSGSATVSADGASIVYASVPGFRGQVSFRYRTLDAFGQSGEATVRVGVLDAESDPRPVTFTDYVQVQAGEDSTIRVNPLENDVDPTGGTLTLTGIRPDVPQTLVDGTPNPAYAEQEERLVTVGETSVRIAAGTTPTTLAYLYDVESDSGNTARGLIVVRVVRDSVPDYPVVADTALTIETRDRFRQGVDVLAGTATWTGGDVDDLEVSLWGTPDGVAVQGDRIRGDLPATTRIIPFAVTGEGRDGPVTTYAFLRVPGADDLDLALRAGTPPERVRELESVDFDMADIVAVARGTRIEVGPGIRASGARPEATCAVVGGTTVRYDAGAGAPWADACQVPVRLVGEEEWTYLAVPIVVEAIDPQPQLRPAALTVAPGETATYDLRLMTDWPLRDGGERIAYAVEYSGTAFEVSLAGTVVTVTGADRGVPGAEDAVVVTVTSFDAVAPARLVLRVGEAPSTLPRGGTVAQTCSQAAGTECVIEVVGAGGEVNPLPRTALELVGVVATGACTGVAFDLASATAARATWAADAPGQSCTAAFQVQDAQGRPTNGDRDGRLTLDLRGFPRAPAALVQTGYADGSLTLRVDAGEAALAYPALTGFAVRYDGTVVATCDATGACPAIAAPNGDQRLYTATAVNEVGESLGSVQTVAWAYDPPAAPRIAGWSPVQTGGEGGLVSLVIDEIDSANTGQLQISSPVGDTITVGVGLGQRRVDVPQFRVGANTATPVTVTPLSRFAVPPGLGGATPPGSAIVQANGVGAPLGPALTLTATSDGDGTGTSTVQASATAAPNGDGSSLRFAIVEHGRFCDPVEGGSARTFPGLRDGQEYAFDVCVVSWYGDRPYGATGATASVRATQSAAAPTGFAFRVDPRPSYEGQTAYWTIRDAPTSGATPPNNNVAVFSGFPTSVIGSDPGIQVSWRHRDWGTTSNPAAVVPAAGSAPYQVRADWGITACTPGGALAYTATSTNGLAAVTADPSGIVYYGPGGVVLPRGEDPYAVPLGTERVDGLRVTVDWAAQGWGLDPASAILSARCS